MKKLSVETWLLVCAQLLLQESLDHAAVQAHVLAWLPTDVRSRVERFEGKRILLFSQRLHGVMRAALLFAPSGAISETLDEHREDIAMAILEADVFDRDARRVVAAEERIAELVVNQVLRMEGRRRALPELDVGRVHRIFFELVEELADVGEVAHARLHETFEKDAGMTLLRHTASTRSGSCTGR